MNRQPEEKTAKRNQAFRKLLSYIGRFKPALIFVGILAVASTAFWIVGPKVLGLATTGIFEGLVSKISGGPGIDFAYITRVLLTLGALYIASFLFSVVQGIMTSGIAQKLSYGFRREISQKINVLPMTYFDDASIGDILSRITNDVDALSQNLNQSLTQIISSLATFFGVLIMMISINVVMTVVALILFPLSAFIVRLIVKRSQRYFRLQQEGTGLLNGYIEESYGGHEVIKLFNGEAPNIESFKKINEGLFSSSWRSQFFSGVIQPIMAFIGNIGYVAVSILGGILAATGRLAVGNIQAFIQYVKGFTQPVNQIAQISSQIQATIAAAERIFAFLNEPAEPGRDGAEEYKDKINGNVSFEHVFFSYNKHDKVIQDFNLEVKSGTKVAIVGPTGSGKTTLVKLLLRFYDLDGGRILLDGKDITEFERTGLRKCFGMVLQDAWLFSGTIMENIRYACPEATDEMVIAAAKAARADYFIRALPEGYDMVINEESSNLSLGQKQLITLARALLADPKILILDEATSSVDTRTEILIQETMDDLMGARTSFVIAHRLSTIKNADVILVLQDGRILEQGTHASLLEKGGFYKELYNAQFNEQTATL